MAFNHDRHPDCLALLPVDSCHWDGCEDGVSALDRLCYQSQQPPAAGVCLNG